MGGSRLAASGRGIQTRREFLKKLGLTAAALSVPGITRAASGPGRRPNIVIIIADDIGYSDVGCYGGEIRTPNIDRMAARGIRFTDFHCENMCAPTRTALLTGRYHLGGLNRNRVTIAEALGAAGYRTCMSGKWHNVGAGGAQPTQRGFERFFGTLAGCGSFFAPIFLTRDGKNAEHEWRKGEFYYTDAISDNAVKYIEETPQGRPLLLYVAYTAAHWPLHALPEDIARYKGKYATGWDKLRLRRHARMQALGIIAPGTPLSPRDPKVPRWEDEPHKAWQQRRMEVYAAQIDRMDQGIGRIVEALRQTGRLDNTVLLFTIDNGGCHVEYGPTRKGPWLNKATRDGRPLKVGNLPDVMPGPEDTWQSYGRGWANASNTPYRLFKQYDHEGGIRVPLIVQWPKRITDGGRITDQLAHVIDLLPTALELGGAEYPGTYKGNEIRPLDGKSLVPILQGKRRKGHDVLFWRFAHGCAVRQGKWKLARVDRRPWELYDLEADPVELRNLASKMPEKVSALEKLWQDWAKRAPRRRRRKGPSAARPAAAIGAIP